ncbi:hypothetical protein DB32_005062 [Sandaracinus amylolyticus]|uniref:Uncharacterized protein n=1 Tax=Sandaracinus amylolyticus TaxID=927083 RepID=A0A0F6YJK3_9BACT|nr:hypothetical protein DB32_005062 [Sandaracinus amylolyticus]
MPAREIPRARARYVQIFRESTIRPPCGERHETCSRGARMSSPPHESPDARAAHTTRHEHPTRRARPASRAPLGATPLRPPTRSERAALDVSPRARLPQREPLDP